MERTRKMSTKTLVIAALMTALVVILQFMGAFIRFGMFSISLVLIPIVIGAVTCGKAVGAWLGLVFGTVVLASGDAGAFLVVDVPRTVLTVLLKGIACGFFAGLTYELVCKALGSRFKNAPYIGAVAAAIVCPVVNTGVFLLGCLAFFMETVAQWAEGFGFGANVGKYMIFVLVGGNFIFEMAVNIIFAPAIVHIIKVVSKK